MAQRGGFQLVKTVERELHLIFNISIKLAVIAIAVAAVLTSRTRE